MQREKVIQNDCSNMAIQKSFQSVCLTKNKKVDVKTKICVHLRRITISDDYFVHHQFVSLNNFSIRVDWRVGCFGLRGHTLHF